MVFFVTLLYLIHISQSTNVYNCNHNATDCSINCDKQWVCNDYTIYCPDYASCNITSYDWQTTISNVEIYCGYLGNCAIECNDCGIVVDVNINANNSLDVSVIINITTLHGKPVDSNNITINAVNANTLTINSYSSLSQSTIYADYVNTFNLKCDSTGSDLYHHDGCSNLNIYVNNANNISIQAYNLQYPSQNIPLNALTFSNIYAPNAYYVDFECQTIAADTWPEPIEYTACWENIFDFSNATNVNFKCIGSFSCAESGKTTLINAQSAENVYFYNYIDTEKNNVYSSGLMTLNGEYASNMTLVFGHFNSKLMYGNAIRMKIYASQNKTTSVYCNGVNSCGSLDIYSINGIKDINIEFQPNCTICGIINNSAGTLYAIPNYQCFQCPIGYYYEDYSMSLHCGADYSKTAVFARRNPSVYNSNYMVCDGECCHNSQFFHGNTFCKHRESSWEQYKYYVIIGGCTFLIILFIGGVIWYIKRRQTAKSDLLLQ